MFERLADFLPGETDILRRDTIFPFFGVVPLVRVNLPFLPVRIRPISVEFPERGPYVL